MALHPFFVKRIINGVLDSWHHYRVHVALPIPQAVYRTLYYEIKKKEPWA